MLANGNVRHMEDVDACLAYTGCDGVMSAESLLANPALFDRSLKLNEQNVLADPLARIALCKEYLELCKTYPTHFRSVVLYVSNFHRN